MWISNATRPGEARRARERGRRRVVEDGVPVAEGATLDIFPRQADAHAVAQQRGQRQLLGGCPVDRALVESREHLRALLAHAFQLAVDGEAVRHAQQRLVQLAQPLDRYGGFGFRRGARRGRRRLRFDVVAFGPQFVHRPLQHRGVLLNEGVGGACGGIATPLERPRPLITDRRVRSDLLVHQRLGERGLVPLVVAVTPIAIRSMRKVDAESVPVCGASRAASTQLPGRQR